MPADMKNIIAHTLLDLMQQKSLDKITVKSLIDTCGISRQTFYYHFQDIMDVLSWIMKQAATNALEQSLKAQSPEEALSIFLSSASTNRQLIQRLLDSQRRAQIEELFVQTTKKYLVDLLLHRSVSAVLPYANVDTALDFWAFGITGVLLNSSSKGPVNAQKLAAQIIQLIPRELL